MNIYFDTEFDGLNKGAHLISLGMITETGEEIYCEFGGINTEIQDEWIKSNVLNNTIMYGDKDIVDLLHDKTLYYRGNKNEIKESLLAWLSQFNDVQLVSDVCHYDMTLFIDIFGTAFDLPSNVNPYCHDINQDIADYLNISDKEAFDLSREELLDKYNITVSGNKHNSLYDAIVIKKIYELIRGE